MTTTLFLQSEIQDPYSLYQKMLYQNPIYWDEENELWALYSYDGCVTILNSSVAYIPEINPDNEQGLNSSALQIALQLARLSNGIHHDIAREVAMFLFSNMNVMTTNKILKELLKKGENGPALDWVNSVCKQLPVVVVLKSFDFNDKDSLFITENIEQLTKIMIPNKTQEQIEFINRIAKKIYSLVEKQLINSGLGNSLVDILSKKHQIGAEKVMSLLVSNLIGLLIQSYDAGRGLLSNALLQILNKDLAHLELSNESDWIQRIVIETLRFDPPIHTTRRVAVEDIVLNKVVVKKGDKILLVLASANRDANQFLNPQVFDTNRNNNGSHLTFGIGGHECLAKHFSVRLATDVLQYLFEKHKSIALLDDKIEYESLSNARLPKNILISIE
ncbi:cytochrome P450 [Flavobacterium taihuense]|uniref:Cytochrome P450 n=1 Tax=Flavobacterium taihuense TaxID=2857508 RepID=A0ABS6XTX5_9FLAO|nr:cytochrome P450 [Flavobacterium taihuense]MBW4360133.1 cytochrome P450 [Flavobacterium taihuense]